MMDDALTSAYGRHKVLEEVAGSAEVPDGCCVRMSVAMRIPMGEVRVRVAVRF